MADPAANPATANDDALSRACEALQRSLRYMPADAKQRLAELADPDTVFVIGVVLLVWGGMQFTFLGPVVDTIAALYGGVKAVEGVGELISAVRQGAQATNEAEIDIAAQRIAKVLVEFLLDVIVGLLSVGAFKLLRQGLKAIRGAKWTPRKPRFNSIVPEVVASAGTGIAIVTKAPDASRFWRQHKTGIIAAGVGGALLVVAIAVVASRGGK